MYTDLKTKSFVDYRDMDNTIKNFDKWLNKKIKAGYEMVQPYSVISDGDGDIMIIVTVGKPVDPRMMLG